MQAGWAIIADMKQSVAVLLFSLVASPLALAGYTLAVGRPAPLFQAKTNQGEAFDLSSRKGKWTVLYFYPKAETPGCTKQACAFRDSIEKIRALNADVYGVSADSVESIAKFHENHHLNFTLIADPDDEVITKYGVKLPILRMAKRWTFIIDPQLNIRFIETIVDPVLDAEKTAAELKRLQTG